MTAAPAKSRLTSGAAMADAFVRSVRATSSIEELASLMEAVTIEMHFRHYALIHHQDLRHPAPGTVDLKQYPAAAVERIYGGGRFHRDPVLRGCRFADSAFLWTELDRIIRLDRHDRESLSAGVQDGLNIGITVPCWLLGDRLGSCTFAGSRRPQSAARYLGPAQLIGIFGFQAARRLAGATRSPAAPPRLHPRPRECVMLAGRGCSNKEIARTLGLTPRTVDGYMTEARELFGAHNRAELVANAILAGEIGLEELGTRQAE